MVGWASRFNVSGRHEVYVYINTESLKTEIVKAFERKFPKDDLWEVRGALLF
jgi:hypothetical protein